MRNFQCVYTFGPEDFNLEGIFTKRDDAVEFARTINPEFKDDGNANGGTRNSRPDEEKETFAVYVIVCNRRMIANHICAERLGELYAPLKKLAGIEDNRPYGHEEKAG